MTALRRVLRFQAAYYIAAGLWPLISMSSFEGVTGPKTDDWLVRMVGLLAAVIGSTIAVGSTTRERIGPELLVLSIGSAAAFALIDSWYALTNQISVLYLADAVLEVGLIVAVLIAFRRERNTGS